MLEITNKVINKDGQVVKDKITYAVHYIITNNSVNSIQCSISTETNGDFTQIGFIRQESGRISTDFTEYSAIVKHLTVFENILKEIEADPDITK